MATAKPKKVVIPRSKGSSAPRTKATPMTDVPQERIKIVEKVLVLDSKMLDEMALQSRQGNLLNPTPADVFQAAKSLVENEKQRYEDASWNMRQTLKRVYKNYIGIFDSPIDKNTGRKKIFTPLTHKIVDATAKPVRITAEALKVKPITEESRGRAKVINMTLPFFYKNSGLKGEITQFKQYLALLGTQVMVTDWLYKEVEVADDQDPTMKILLNKGFVRKEKYGTKTVVVITDRPRVSRPNLLDLWMPFKADSLAWACEHASVIMRSTQTLDEIQANPLYDDESKVMLRGTSIGSNDQNNSDAFDQYNSAAFLGNNPSTKTQGQQDFYRQERPLCEVFERYGMVPKSWITYDAADALQYVPAIITCAADSVGGALKTLCVRMSPFGVEGPFEEAWFNKLEGRWYGEGIGERLVGLQIWQNEAVNTRRNQELMLWNKMFKYKKGSVNPNDFRSRPSGGIAVKDMADVEMLETGDVKVSNFQEDAAIGAEAQAVAGVALTPVAKKVTASENETIQANSNLTYEELKDGIEDFLERLLDRHLLPLLKKYYKGGETIPVGLPQSELAMLDTLNGYEPWKEAEVGMNRFMLIPDGQIFQGEYETTADIEAVTATRGTKIQALQNMIGMATKIQNSGMNLRVAFRKLSELVGIVDERLFEDATAPEGSGVAAATLPSVAQRTAPPAGAPQPMAM